MGLWTLVREILSLSNLIGPLAAKVVDVGADGLSWAYSSLSRLLDVETELEKLRRTVVRIQALLKDAEETRFIDDSTVRHWLSELKDITFDAEDLLDEFQTVVNVSKLKASHSRKRKRPWHSLSVNPLWLRSRNISQKIKEIGGRYDAIADDRKRLRLRKGESKRRAQVREERLPPEVGSLQSEPSVGMDDQRREIVQLLTSGGGDGVAVVSVVGAGGMGKTTLARLAFCDEEVVNFFPSSRFWVGVSQGFDAKKTAMEIIEVMTGERCDLLNWELLQCHLQRLVRGKKFLLVLDGVWNEEQYYWEILRAPLMDAGNGSRVLITTRSKFVWRNMRPLPPIHLNGLKEEQCWSLFRERAFEPGAWDRHQNLAEIGREIVRKCQGSPLAAKSIGGLLYKKTDEEEWRSVLSDLPDPEDDANQILLTLKVSYDHLPLHLKQCFAFCSIFPNGYEFDRDELVKLWIAVGLVKPRGERSLENIGGKYFDYLSWRSFFHISSSNQQSKMWYKMPGLIHELAQSVSKDECLRLENDTVHGESKNARYALSCLQNMEHGTFQKIYEENKSLRALILLLPENGVPTRQVPHDIFLNFKCLRALDLSLKELVALPDSIGNLIHLRYLKLYGTQIVRLPESVSKLYNLQVLELGECNELLELPKGMSNLVNLRHLGLHLDWDKHRNGWTDLISMPPGIGQLTCLQTLSRFSVSAESGCGLGQLKDLNLHGELCISKLENVVNVEDAKDANLKNKKYIDFVMLRWSESTSSNLHTGSEEQVIGSLQPHTNIRSLWIENYNGTSFPNWLQDQSFTNLETLRLSNCGRCAVLPLVGKLPQLRNLYLEGLPEVQHMSWMVPGNGNTTDSRYNVIEGEMACLKKLVISDCPKINELSHLPHSLEYFEIRNCQELLSLRVQDLPSLQFLKISSCPKLSSFAEGISRSLKLSISQCLLLEQRCRRNGPDWPMLQNIPYKEIDESSLSSII